MIRIVRSRSFLLPFLAMMLIAGIALADIVIDDFSVSQGPLSAIGTADDHNADNASIFGGERNLHIVATDTSGGVLQLEVTTTGGSPPEALKMTRPDLSQGELSVWWDGDNDSTTFNPDFLASPVDLTDGGTLNALRVQTIATSDVTVPLALKVYSDSTNYSTALFTLENGDSTQIRFTDFTAVGGTGATFSSVKAIHLGTFSNSSSGAFTAEIGSISTIFLSNPAFVETGTNDFRTSNAGITDGDNATADLPAIAANGEGEALVVWQQNAKLGAGDSSPQEEIFGQLINSATGASIGSDFKISDMGGTTAPTVYGAQNPDVVYNATADEYFVVWRGDDDENGMVNNELEIFGQRVNSNGSLDGANIRISHMGPDGDTTGSADNPAVAWDSFNNRYLVVWQGWDSSTAIGQEIHGRILNSDGTAFSADDTRISNVGLDLDLDRLAIGPDVAFDAGTPRFLVVWSGDDIAEAFDIYGQFVTTAGAEDGSDFRISDLGDDDNDTNFGAFSPRLAYNSIREEFLVVFEGDDDSYGDDVLEVFARSVSAAGAVLANDNRVSGQESNPNVDEVEPDLAYKQGSDAYVVVWRGDRVVANDHDVWIRRLDGAGDAIDQPTRISDMGPPGSTDYLALSPAVDYSTSRAVAVWRGEDDIGVNQEVEIYGQLLKTTASAADTTIVASPTTRMAGESSTITVQVYDDNGDDISTGGHSVTLATTLGTIGAVQDNGDGTYSATLQSTVPGTATITGTVEGEAITDDATVTYSPGPISVSQTTITADPTSITANGSSTSTITVQAKDAYGNNLTTGGSTVVLQTDLGDLGGVTDNSNGTYTATLTSTITGTATITGFVQGIDDPFSDTATVTFTPGPASAAMTVITADPTSITASGTSTSVITVQAKDENGNNLTSGGATVILQTDRGSIGAVTDNSNGTYTATLTSSTSVETATITGTINSSNITDTATVDFTPVVATMLLVEAPSNATGGTAFNVTVTATDANSNTDAGYTGTVQFSSSAGSATLPSNYTFTGGDAGVHVFSVTLNSAGNITVTATDTVTGTITGNDVVAVKGDTTTVLSSSDTSSVVGQSVTFTATVSSTTTGTITGTVTFKDGAATLGSGSVSSGTATYTTSALAAGTHSITAEYGGSTNFNASTSSAVSQEVTLSSFGPPAIVSATASSASVIGVAWTPTADATDYNVYRSTLGGLFTLLTTVSAPTTSFNNTGLTPNQTYVYKISTLNGATESALSAADAATTLIFTDPTLSSSILVKKTHLDELRVAVNAMRAAAGLPDAVFTDSTIIAQSTLVKRLHIIELRTALDEARAALGLAALNYTDNNITAGSTTIKDEHFAELRAGTQ